MKLFESEDDFLETCHDLIGDGEDKEAVVDELVTSGLDEEKAEDMYDEEYSVLADDLSDYLKSEGLLEAIFASTLRASGLSSL